MTNRDSGAGGGENATSRLANFMGGMFGHPGPGNQSPPGPGNQQQQQQQQPQPGGGQPSQEEEDPELAEMLAGIINNEEPPQFEMGDDGKPKLGADGKPIQKKKTQPAAGGTDDDDGGLDHEAIATRLADGIAGIRLPEDFNIDDLQSDDPVVRRKAFSSIQQQSVVHAVQLTLPILQTALGAMQKQFDSKLKSALETARQGISIEQVLRDEVAAYADPKFKGMVEFLNTKYEGQGMVNPYDRAKAINKILGKMGVTVTRARSNSGGGGGGEESLPVRRERETLDLYMPAPGG